MRDVNSLVSKAIFQPQLVRGAWQGKAFFTKLKLVCLSGGCESRLSIGWMNWRQLSIKVDICSDGDCESVHHKELICYSINKTDKVTNESVTCVVSTECCEGGE